MKSLRIINNFLHDMATGTWIACILVIAVVHSKAAGVSAQSAQVLHAAAWSVFWLLIIALVIVMATGGLRTLYWRKHEVAENDAKDTFRLLIIKHVILTVIFGAGTVIAWLLIA